MIEETRDWSSVQDQYGSVIARICSIGVRPSPEKSSSRKVAFGPRRADFPHSDNPVSQDLGDSLLTNRVPSTLRSSE